MLNKIKTLSEWGRELKAFTLAEVLITLVVIGVIAAITVPTVIESYNKLIFKNRLKKSLSTITNAIRKTEFDMGGNINCYQDASGNGEGSDCEEFYSVLSKNLKTMKICYGHAKRDKCIPDPYMKYYVVTSGCRGYKQDVIEDITNVYILNDGTFIIPYRPSGQNHSLGTLFMIDINGEKKPNYPGQDIVSLRLYKDKDNNLTLKGSSLLNCFSNENLGISDFKPYYSKISDIYDDK